MVEILTDEEILELRNFLIVRKEEERRKAFELEILQIDNELYNVVLKPIAEKFDSDRQQLENSGATFVEIKVLADARDAEIEPIHEEYKLKFDECRKKYGY